MADSDPPAAPPSDAPSGTEPDPTTPPAVAPESAPLLKGAEGATAAEFAAFVALKKTLLDDSEVDDALLPDDVQLFRFCCVCLCDAAAAEAMARTHIAWRAEKRHILEAAARDVDAEGGISDYATAAAADDRAPNDGESTGYSPPALLCDLLPMAFKGFTGMDNDGYPVWVMRAGEVDTWSLVQAFEGSVHDAAIYWMQAVLEAMKRLSATQERCVHRCTAVIDVGGFGAQHLSDVKGLAFFYAYVQMATANYPEIFRHIFIINAGMVFPSLFATIQPLLPERDRKVIKILGGAEAYMPVLEAHLPLSCVPAVLGGTMRDPDEDGYGSGALCGHRVPVGGSVSALLMRRGGLAAPVAADVKVEVHRCEPGDAEAIKAGGDCYAVVRWTAQVKPLGPGVPDMDPFSNLPGAANRGPSSRFELWWAQDSYTSQWADHGQPIVVAAVGAEGSHAFDFKTTVYGLYSGYAYVAKLRARVGALKAAGEWSEDFRFTADA
jgi:hypothetical protein